MPERRVCVVTGSRAEYGLLYWLLKEIENSPSLDLQLVVTGAHLDAGFGDTVDTITGDGFTIDARVPMNLDDTSPAGVGAAMGRALTGLSAAFDELQPQILVILGDRYEMLAAASAATVLGLPIAHIHGGEVTTGAMDDAMRHAISKLSHLHFAAAEPYRRRVIQMGENPDHVFTVGEVGLDNIARLELMDRPSLEAGLGFVLGEQYFVATYHPETLGELPPAEAVQNLLAALDAFEAYKIIFTGVNADPGRDVVAAAISDFAGKQPERARLVQSLGQVRYLSALKHCAAVVGNSSSGVIEAPAMAVPTVNVGNRQKGRLRAPSVIDCGPATAAIAAAIGQAISPGFTENLKKLPAPDGQTSRRIAERLAEFPLEGLLQKEFYDMEPAVHA